MKKVAERFDTRKQGISVRLFICAALLAWFTVAPGYNPGVTTATAHTAISGGDPSIGSASYYGTADYVLDARSIGVMCTGDDPPPPGTGSGSGSGSSTGVSASAHGYAEATLLRQLYRGLDAHKNVHIEYDVSGHAYAYARAGSNAGYDHPSKRGEPTRGKIGIYKEYYYVGRMLLYRWVKKGSFGVDADVYKSDVSGSHYAISVHGLTASGGGSVRNRAEHRSGPSPP